MDKSATLKVSSSIILNRVCICAFAVLFLWTTTLSNATAITAIFVSSPGLDHMNEICSNAYTYVDGQRREYESCASRQMDSCTAELNAAYIKEKERIDVVVTENADIINEMTIQDKICSKSWMNIQGSVSTYIEQTGTTLSYNQPSCSEEQVLWTKEALNDNSAAREELTTELVDYSKRADGTVVRLVHHIDALDAYNRAYAGNKTEALRGLSRDIVASVATPQLPKINIQLHNLTLPFSAIQVCGGALDSCSLGSLSDSFQLYEAAVSQVNAQIGAVERSYEDLAEEIEYYTSSVSAALAKADGFYVGVMGAAVDRPKSNEKEEEISCLFG